MKSEIFLHNSGVVLHPKIIAKISETHIADDIAALMIFGVGFAPITSLALALMEISTLRVASVILVVPAIVFAMSLGYVFPRYGKLMLRGFSMGVIAVACYDCLRIPLTIIGLLNDFIPQIGGMLIDDGKNHTAIGYLWRYLGNGGGMGMAFVCAFTLLRQRLLLLNLLGGLQSALLFGCIVWACLIATLLISPQGEEIMFVINPTSLLLSLMGHLVFGYTLGFLVDRWIEPQISI
jgi:hypothetical protein